MKTGNFKHQRVALAGGMGAIAPMERSATEVEMLTSSDAGRGEDRCHDEASLARLDRQIGLGVPVASFVGTVAAL